MRLLMFILAGATVLPLAALLAGIWPALAPAWRRSSAAARLGLAALWLLGAGFLLLRPHDDSFTGLDNMTYRNLAQAFLEGRGFHDPDTILAEVPAELRENFLLHPGPVGRPTRDRVFQLSGWQSTDTQPFFMPVLSLAAAGLEPVLAPERLVPVVGALWLALVLAAGFCAGGGWGLMATAALVLGTAWPAWFLRGFFAEGAGAALATGVMAAAAVRPLRAGIAVVAGFALGLAVSFHPTLAVLAGPAALALMLERRDGRTVAGLVVGLLAGVFPFWALTRWVCQPNGDWTRWASLWRMISWIPEIRATALAVGVLALVSLMAIGTGFVPSVRAWLRKWEAKLAPWGWLVVCAVPGLVIAFLPGAAGETLRSGAAATWSGIRWPCGLLFLAGAGVVLSGSRPVRERFWLAALCWAVLMFLFIKGVETPVGLWSQRRFLPVALAGIALLAAPLSALAASFAGRGRGQAGGVALALAVAGLWNILHWPAAYFTIDERGATAWTEAVAEKLGTGRRIVFDYYPHSVPYAADLKHRVLGLGEMSWKRWPEVAAWLAPLAGTEEVWVATSWSPTALEAGFRLEPVFAATGLFPVVKTKAFFPAEPGARTVNNAFFRAVPLGPGETAGQDKVLDGSPVGLRGPWGQVRNGATWTRQGSGLIGPVPEKGVAAVFEATCEWAPPAAEWPEQILLVTPPWGGDPLRLAVTAGAQTVMGTIRRPADDGRRPPTGIYAFSVARSYNPAAYGLRGYSTDLGVLLRRVIIRVEPGAPSVPN